MTFACMILAATLAVQADKPFVSQAGTFKVAMPSAPKEQNLKVPTEIGEI